ncbi:MAG: hypothetical protein E7678_06480 [Ruminococcaceae bacterium]|nr:hypothetical protein [Oscillospiraceae bacterium]
MKKNAMLKIAAILMVAVLLTTCAISSTFAKYTTTGAAGTASARVAKWGVTIDTTITGLFVDTYDADSDDEVISFNGADVVAPGTEGSVTLATSIKGTPEVAVAVTTDADLTLANWEVDSAYYCPLVFTITLNSVAKTIKTGDVIEGENVIDTAAELETAVEAAIEAATKEYAAGTDLSAATDFDLTIAWSWAFTGDDVKDTALGNAGLNPVDGSFDVSKQATVALSITQTVTQLDSIS